MRNLLNPKWLLLATVGPLLLLAALCYGEFSVIHSLLPPASVGLWKNFGLGLGGLGLASLGYLGWAWAHEEEVETWYAVAALVGYGMFVGLYTALSDEVLPRTIPRWMVPTDLLIYVWTFVMPALAHALLVLVVRFTPANRPHSAIANLGLAIAVPVGAWMSLGLLFALWGLVSGWFEGGSSGGGYVLLVGALAVGPLLFLFFLVRAVYILSLNQKKEWGDYGIIWKVVLTTVLPVLGLAVNSGLFFGRYSTDREAGIFGNFNSPWFFGLAVLNGVLLCLPADRLGPRGRLALLGARSALLGYTGYFFLVFLPFLPLSMVAVIALGSGFLMLAPLMLLVLHVGALHDDLGALGPYYSPLVRRAVLVGGLAVLSLGLTGSYWHQRQVLHEALEYTYSPDYAKHYDLDAPALTHALAVVQQHKDSNWDLFMGSQQPYLSAYYNWLVLDNLTLPESKIADLQKIFLGAELPDKRARWNRWTPGTNFAENQGTAAQPALRQLSARSTYDAKEQAWVSWVDLEIANTDVSRQAEYSTALTLPPGCWVGNYYLDIGPRREFGILAERKAATWVYSQIVNERSSRDPGLLSYLGPNQLSLRVYPVSGGEARRTGIQLLHKEPLALTIDGRTVQLGTPGMAPASPAPLATPGGAVVYLGAAAKRQLPLVQRQPYYHFLLDVSQKQTGAKASYGQRVQALLRTQPLAVAPRFSLVNTYTETLGEGADWQRALTEFKNAGGCYLTGAMRRTLTAAQLHPAATYPRLVVVTDSLGNAVLPADFADLQAAYPESDEFYVLLPDGRLETHSLRQAPATPLAAALPPAPPAVRAWPTATHALAYLPDTDEAALVLPHPTDPLAVPGGASTRWMMGLLLHGFGQWQSLHPEVAERGHVPFIQASFRAGILTPLTAYLALENDAQKAALQRKQAEVLAANLNLDAQETELPHPASDATAVPLNSGQWLLLLLGLALGVRQLRQRCRVAG